MPTLYRRLLARFGLILLLLAAGLAQNIHKPAPAAASEVVALTNCTTTIPQTAIARTADLTVATCAVKMAGAGTLVILTDGFIDNGTKNFSPRIAELRLIVRVNGVVAQTQYNDWNNFALRVAVPAQAGTHTVTVSASRRWGTDAGVVSGNLSVLGVPNAHPGIKVCGATNAGPVTTTSSSFTNPVYCSLQAPSAGKVVILASANQYFFDAQVAANYRVGVAGVTALDHSDRFIDTWGDPYDGTDVAVSTLGIVSVSAGQTIEVGLMARRAAGNGTVALREASVIGLFLPDGGPLPWCSSVRDAVDGAFDTLGECSLTSAQPGSALIITDVSVGITDASHGGAEIDTMIGVGTSSYDKEFILTRYSFMSAAFLTDATAVDHSIPASTIKPLSSGYRYFYFRSIAPATHPDSAELTDPGMAVIFIPAVRIAP